MTSDILIRKEGDTSLTNDIKKKVSTYMEKKYKDIKVNELLDVATFLDPRFKMTFVDESEKESVQERVVREGTDVAQQQNEGMEDSSRPDDLSAVATAPPEKKRKLGTVLKLSMGGGSSDNSQAVKTPEEKAKAEVEAYLRVPEQDAEDNPLQRWKAEERNYPV